MGKVVWLLWELSQLSTAVPAALPYKDMLPVLRLGNAKRPGWVNRWWYLQVQCLETKKGSKRFNSKEWRLCFAHVGLINLGSVFFPAHSFSWHPFLSIFSTVSSSSTPLGLFCSFFCFPADFSFWLKIQEKLESCSGEWHGGDTTWRFPLAVGFKKVARGHEQGPER